MRPKSGRIVYAGFDFPHPIRFRSVLFVSVRFPSSKEGPDHVVQKQARIQSGWPAQILANRICFRRKPVCKNHRARFCPLSYSFAFFHRRDGSYLLGSLDHIYCAAWIIFIVQPGSALVRDGCRILARRIRFYVQVNFNVFAHTSTACRSTATKLAIQPYMQVICNNYSNCSL